MEKRKCKTCKKSRTYKYEKYKKWYKYNDGYICHKCYLRLIQNPNRITFLSKRFKVNFKIRHGICMRCGLETNNTDIHHIEYIVIMPVLAMTVELCDGCHKIENIKQEQEGPDYKWSGKIDC